RRRLGRGQARPFCARGRARPVIAARSHGARVRLAVASVTEGSALADEAIISLRGVTKSFGSHTVLQDITFDVPKGRITAILGPSGTGKSVLLKNIIGLLRPDAGEIWVDGENVVDPDLYGIGAQQADDVLEQDRLTGA